MARNNSKLNYSLEKQFYKLNSRKILEKLENRLKLKKKKYIPEIKNDVLKRRTLKNKRKEENEVRI